MNKLWLFGLVAVLLVISAGAAVLSPDATGFNSQTYQQNYNDMARDLLDPTFNTTITFSNGTHSFLTVPEYDSSTTNLEANLVETYTYISPANFSVYEIRSDLFSEVGIVLAMSNQTTAFDNWFNTLKRMAMCDSGTLPCWDVIRNGTTFYLNASTNDTAIDGSIRSAQALYLASLNTAFSTAKRAEYNAYFEQMIRDSYDLETISITATSTDSGVVNRVPMGGADCASFGLGCSVDMWVGYMPEIALTYQYAYLATGNETYNLFARNVTAEFLQVSLQNDTDADGFGVAPFNFNWDGVGGTLGHTDGGDVNSYHYDPLNTQWEDSDAPRAHMAGMVYYQAQQMNQLDGVYTDLGTYLSAWQGSGTLTNDTSCLQYYYNGTCSVAIQGGYYQNGFGGLLFLGQNTSLLDDKLSEAISHYSWSGMTFDSTTGGTAGTYRGVRPTKLLGYSIGLSDSLTGNTTITDFTLLWQDANDTVTGGSATWYADLQTSGDRLFISNEGIFLTNIQYTQGSNYCTASQLAILSSTVNTSQFSATYSDNVTCIPSSQANLQNKDGDVCIAGFDALAEIGGFVVLAFLAVIMVFAIGMFNNNNMYSVISSKQNSAAMVALIVGFVVAILVFLFIAMLTGSIAYLC